MQKGKAFPKIYLRTPLETRKRIRELAKKESAFEIPGWPRVFIINFREYLETPYDMIIGTRVDEEPKTVSERTGRKRTTVRKRIPRVYINGKEVRGELKKKLENVLFRLRTLYVRAASHPKKSKKKKKPLRFRAYTEDAYTQIEKVIPSARYVFMRPTKTLSVNIEMLESGAIVIHDLTIRAVTRVPAVQTSEGSRRFLGRKASKQYILALNKLESALNSMLGSYRRYREKVREALAELEKLVKEFLGSSS